MLVQSKSFSGCPSKLRLLIVFQRSSLLSIAAALTVDEAS